MTAPARPRPPAGHPHAEVWSWVHRAQDGDSQAFGLIYDRYRYMLISYVYKRIADREIAQDVVQEVFLKTLRNIRNVHWTGSDLGAYLVTCARNILRDRGKRAYLRLEQGIYDPEVIDCEEPSPGPEALALRLEVRALILDAMRVLTPEQRDVVILRYFNDCTNGQAAQVLGIDEGAVKARMRRATRAMAAVVPPEAIDLVRS